jgi:hypothetical protein
MTLLLIFVALIAVAYTLLLHAYLPELTDDEEELNDLTKTFVAGPGIATIGFIMAVISVSAILGVKGDGPIARIAVLIALIILIFCFSNTWGHLLQPRPASNTLKEGQSLLTAGFQQILSTLRRLYRTNPNLLWFYAGVALGDVKPLTSIALTFLSESQKFTSTDVGLAAITMLLSAIPGAALSAYFNRKINPVRSSMLALLLMAATTIIGAGVLTGRGQKLRTFVIVAFWGAFGGWKLASTQMLVSAILPNTGQETELMVSLVKTLLVYTLYLVCNSLLTWLQTCPPFFFARCRGSISFRICPYLGYLL